MKDVLLAATILAAIGATSVKAQAVDDDPLHLCYSTGCEAFNGVTISVNHGQGFEDFGVSSSPAPQTGTLWFALLVPNNETQVNLPSLAGTLNGKSFGDGSVFKNVGTFGAGQDLTSILGGVFASASPKNPFGAYAGATAAVDSGFNPLTGKYTVYFAQIGGPNAFTTGKVAGQTTTMDNSFTLDRGSYIDALGHTDLGIGTGSILTAFMVETTTKGHTTTTSVISTAQSSSLIDGAIPSVVTGSVPEPSTWAMGLAGFAMLGFVGWRKKVKISRYAFEA